MVSMKAVINTAARGEVRKGGHVHVYDFQPGEHDVHPEVLAVLKAAGIATKATKKAASAKETK